mmetsp:Transcript_84408/g.188748  ORF Transcript_84408/g.188748 Transcript_84408/m.188748 type:complete len:246 (+) Transcript_84408:211-948(+)
MQGATSPIVGPAAGHHGARPEILLAGLRAAPERVQADLLVAAALHVFDADAPMLEAAGAQHVRLEGILEEGPRESRVLRKEHAAVNATSAILEPVLIGEEEVLPRLLQSSSHLPQGIIARPDERRVRIQHQDMTEVLGAEEVLGDQQVLLPVVILALIVPRASVHALLLPFASGDLPRRELRLRRLHSHGHCVAMPPSVRPVHRQASTEPLGPARSAPAPSATGVQEDRLHDEHPPANGSSQLLV